MKTLKEIKLLKVSFFAVMMLISNVTIPNIVEANDPDPVEVPELTVDNVKEAIIEAGIHSEIVLKQAILETGWLKCTNCSLTRNNIFGFIIKRNTYLLTTGLIVLLIIKDGKTDII